MFSEAYLFLAGFFFSFAGLSWAILKLHGRLIKLERGLGWLERKDEIRAKKAYPVMSSVRKLERRPNGHHYTRELTD